MEELQKAGGNLVRIQRLLSARSSLIDGARGRFPSRPLGIALERVSFRYPAMAQGTDQPEEEMVLRDLSLTIARGVRSAFWGAPAAARPPSPACWRGCTTPTAAASPWTASTCVRSGCRWWRARIAVVTQEVQFFGGTIRDNLALFDDAVDDDRIVHALDRLHLLPWLTAQPDGWKTIFSSAQLALSAGEAQRLALARVLLRDPTSSSSTRRRRASIQPPRKRWSGR